MHDIKVCSVKLVWVLSSSSGYALPQKVVVERTRHILGLPTIDTENAVQVAQALKWYEQGMDFADALHLASSTELSGFATMDSRMVRKVSQLSISAKLTLIA